MDRNEQSAEKPERKGKKSRLRWSIGLGIILFIAISVGAWQLLRPSVSCGPSGTHAPDFSLEDLEGKAVKLRDFNGKVTLLDFMATWCGPCRASMPGLKALWSQYREQLVLVSIGVDPIYDTEERLKRWIDEWEAEWIHARDTADPPVSRLYDIIGIPTYVILDKDGCIRHRHIGLTPTETLSKEIAALVEE